MFGLSFRRAALGLRALGFLLLVASPLGAAEGPQVIRNDLGGSLERRVAQISSLAGSARPIEIRGDCASSCTLYLGLPQTCVSETARLGFHGPQSQIQGIGLTPSEFEYWAQLMASYYPPEIQSWFLTKASKVTSKVFVLSGRDAIRMGARACV